MQQSSLIYFKLAFRKIVESIYMLVGMKQRRNKLFLLLSFIVEINYSQLIGNPNPFCSEILGRVYP